MGPNALVGKRILVIDDESLLCQLVKHIFTREGAEVCEASSGAEGIQRFQEEQPDLVLLDVMMPGIDGWEVCEQLRAVSDVPIIMLTALNRSSAIKRGLDVGADDFVSKPFKRDVLLARARAVLRRTEFQSQLREKINYSDGYLNIDLDDRKIDVDGRRVRLHTTEFNLLGYLLKNAGRVCTFSEILEYVWGAEYRLSAEYVHEYIWHLRQKIEADPKKPAYLISEHSVGYRFVTVRGR
jgi:DNA-binding response OmpR family regulator